MSALLALPNETLLQIIEDICPDDLLNFALSCKRMISLSHDGLKLDGERRKSYATIKFYECPRHDDDAHPSTLLHDIFNSWRLAFFPRSITILCCDCRGTFVPYNEHKETVEESGDHEGDDNADDAEEAEDIEDIEPLDRVLERFERTIMEKIDQTGFPRYQAAKVQDWGIGRRGTVLGPLLNMLPNLENLTLGQYAWGANTFGAILWNAIEADLDPDYTGPVILQDNNASEPMRVGQLPVFIPMSDPADKIYWIGISSAQVFSPRSRGVFSPLITDEDPGVMVGSKAYEVIVKQPVKVDYTTDRTEVMPTGRIVGEVVGVCRDNIVVLVKAGNWFVESDVFKMGTWRSAATEPLNVGDDVQMEVAVPR